MDAQLIDSDDKENQPQTEQERKVRIYEIKCLK